MTGTLLTLLVTGTALVLAGAMLARAADGISTRTGLGRLWIGSVLLAAATSLPEFTTDVAAVRLGVPDLGAGDLFGSSMANMVILALIGLVPPQGEIFRRATLDHALSASLAMTLNALAALFVLLHPHQAFGGLGPGAASLLLVYLVGTRIVYRHGRRVAAANAGAETGVVVPAPEPGADQPPTHILLLRFLVAAGATFVAAPFFAVAAQRLAVLTGLGSTFVGTWIVGMSTSLPEIVSSLAAVRMGAFDLAVGNLFGSNSLNMVVFFAMDLAYPGGSIFGAIRPEHALSALVAIVLMSLGLSAIVFRAERRVSLLEPGSALMLVVYAVGLWMLYARTVGH